MGALEAGLQVGQYFVEISEIGEDDLAAARLRADATGMPVPIHLVAVGQIRRGEALKAIAGRVGIEYFEPGPWFQAAPEAIARMPAPAAVAEVALPLRLEAGRLVVATDDPFDESRRRRLETLTDREREVLELVLVGKLNKQIADTLGISMKTIEVHRARVMEKMGVHSVAELVQAAMAAKGSGSG